MYWLKPIYFSTQRRGDAEFLKFFEEKFSAPPRLCVEKYTKFSFAEIVTIKFHNNINT